MSLDPLSGRGQLARAVGVLAAALLVGVSAPAASAAAVRPDDAVGVRLLDAPTDRRDDPRAQTYIVDHLAPGQGLSRRIEVSNTTRGPVQVQLYPAAAKVENESFVFAPGREGNDLTDWTSVDPAAVTVPAAGTAIATVRVAVPADASPGERYAVVWAELPPATGGQVAAINRVGIRMYLSVGPGGEPAPQFTITSLQARRNDQGAPQVLAQITNTGGRALDLTGQLTLSGGPGGITAGPVPAERGTTAGVGQPAQVVFTLDPQLPAGPWTANAIMRSGRLEHTASAQLTFPDKGTADAVTPQRPLLWIILAALAAALLLALLTAILTRRRRQPQT